ncbi:MAG: GNAT family N-acetyltransferase [Chitinophagaceae bacterium]
MSISEKFKITKLTSKNKYKELTLSNKDFFLLPYSTCIDKDCTIYEKQSNLFVGCKNGGVKIFPTYCKKDEIGIGGFSIELLIKEITDEDELKSYESLSKYHYKEKDLFGRTSILIATNTTPYLPKVIGYIELATPFYVNKPRSEVLNAPFKHNGINWDLWDKNTTKKYINTIVRIARCVVYPEFRGVGLGKILIQHAEMFAKERWQISKLKPLFLEISADMLKYVPFAEKAGMHYIGETEGNLNRIHKDLRYLLTNYKRYQNKEIVSDKQMGIVEQQKSRLRKAWKLAEQAGLTIEEFIDRLEKLQKEKTLKDFAFFNGLVSLPKPTYIKGLDEISENFLLNRTRKINSPTNIFYDKIQVSPIQTSIILEELSISYNSKIRRTQKTQAIHNAFSISPTDIESPIIKKLSVEIKPGEIVFIIGSSGSGKTTLINFLSGLLSKQKNVQINGNYTFPSNCNAEIFREIKSSKALVEVFGKFTVDFSLQLMGTVGLSDAYVYLKRYEELSKGQQFRAQLAQALLSRCNILIIDEFCSNLDPVTSNVIAHRLRHLAKRLGITLVAAAAHCENFIHSLQPDKVLRLSTAWDYEIIGGREFANQYPVKKHKLNIQVLHFKYKYLLDFIAGEKHTTIRKGKPKLKLGAVILESSQMFVTGYIKEITEKKVSQLSLNDAKGDGFSTVAALKRTLKRIYPDLKNSSIVSIYKLDLLNFS